LPFIVALKLNINGWYKPLIIYNTSVDLSYGSNGAERLCRGVSSITNYISRQNYIKNTSFG